MLKRLTRKLFTLVVLCAALASLSFGPVTQKAGAKWPPFCARAVDESGNCAYVCCDDVGCYVIPC